mmetsp:Transcript_69138/g.154229  ORF Transcript_69138/g.154229 Transcript_69138/m.154229 type:complete len:224 (-) Transcript_69138:363-1034(-)
MGWDRIWRDLIGSDRIWCDQCNQCGCGVEICTPDAWQHCPDPLTRSYEDTVSPFAPLTQPVCFSSPERPQPYEPRDGCYAPVKLYAPRPPRASRPPRAPKAVGDQADRRVGMRRVWRRRTTQPAPGQVPTAVAPEATREVAELAERTALPQGPAGGGGEGELSRAVENGGEGSTEGRCAPNQPPISDRISSGRAAAGRRRRWWVSRMLRRKQQQMVPVGDQKA